MDTNTAIVLVVALLVISLIITAVIALSRRGSVKGSIKTKLGEGSLEAESKDVSEQAHARQWQLFGRQLRQRGAKGTNFTQVQIGGTDKEQTIE